MASSNPYKPTAVEILKVINETADTKTFRLKLSHSPMPGMFYELSLFGYGEVPISVASYNDKYVDFCIRNVGTVTSALHKLSKGDKIYVRGPYGNGYPMQNFKDKDITIIAGGTGVAPVKGAIEYIEKHKNDYKNIKIFLGYRSYDDILFNDAIKRWQKNFNVAIALDKKDPRWSGSVGVITKLIKKTRLNPDSVYILCGPPIMLKFVIQELKTINVPDENIYISFERFMQCGIGKCGHCMIEDKYVCKDGPVFRYDSAKYLKD